jgi:hypothetical protein
MAVSQQKRAELLVHLKYVQQFKHRINTSNTSANFSFDKPNICLELWRVFKELLLQNLVPNNYLTE